MRWLSTPSLRWSLSLVAISSLFISPVFAQQKGKSITINSLEPCMEDSKFSATLFDIALLPNTSKLHFDINGFSTVQGYVTLSFTVFAYGFPAVEMGYDPCKNGWQQLCPMAPGKVEVNSSEALGEDTITQIPSIAYDVPDIDGIIRIEVMAADGDKSRLACVDGRISNGQTVEQAAVAWSTAIVTGTFLMATILATAFSSPDSPLYGPATHKFALYSLILFTFLQTQALIGMTSIPLPPITAAWAQNFMWAVGIVKIRSLQRFFHWYITATGGSISDLLRQTSTNILVTKRDVVPSTTPMGERDFSATGWNGGMGLGGLKKRVTEDLSQYQHITVKGIERVAYKAGIERTNLFITAYSIFIVFIAVILVLFLIFRGVVAIMAKKRVMGMENRLLSFRARWREALKAIMFSIIVIAYPGILALCLWELTMKDSAAAVVLAVVMFLVLTGLMGYAVFRVLMILKKASITPFGKAGILGKARVDREKNISGVSDPTTDINTANAASDLKQFALLTMPYRTGTVYWALLLLICVFVKSALVGLAQQHLYNAPGAGTALGKGKGAAQAIGFLVVDLAFFIGFVITKPWFDKRTNAIGITVGVIGVLNAIFLVIFSDIFAGQPPYLASILGVVFFVINGIIALVLMVLTIMASIYAIIDWKKGKRSEVPIAASPVESEPASYQPSGGFGTPDPFMVQSHRNHSVPSSTLGGTDGRNPTSGIILGKDVDAHEHQRHGSVSESLDSAAQMHDMQPTEPNMSSSNLGRGGLVHSMVPPPPHSDGYAGHPLGHVQTNSMGAQSLGLAGSGVVGVGGGPGSAAYAESTRSGKSNHGVVGVPLQPYPPQFQRQESHMSLRSVKSSHSQRSFQRPPPSPVNHGYDTQGVPRHPSTRSTSREYFREPRTNSRMPVHEQQQPPPPNSPLPSPGQAM